MDWDLVHTPLSFGGCGLLAFTSELPSHSLSQCFALRALLHSLGETNEPWTIKEQAAWTLVSDDLSIPLALHRDEASLQLNGDAHSLRPLRNTWYKVRTPPETCRPSPRLSPAQGLVDPAVCIFLSAQLIAALAWWCFPAFSAFLHDGAFLAAWCDRMQLAVPPAGCVAVSHSGA